MGHIGFGHGMWGIGIWAFLWMLVFWGALIALGVWVVRNLLDGSRSSREAITILEERFARGEIDLEEFEKRRAALEKRR
ncbi:MAG: hypothetical protein KatS3mg011_1432 [Acidimicrobiia bacterium]|nr:MAG: hypothetical protein KatS3mg011_1432 [Acidimicrobiia bacterium]